jgi:hypothetical protein
VKIIVFEGESEKSLKKIITKGIVFVVSIVYDVSCIPGVALGCFVWRKW